MLWPGNPIRWIRGVIPALVMLLLAGIVILFTIMAVWGVPAQWNQQISSELAAHGLHIKFQSLKLNIFKGIVARDVEVHFPEPDSPPILLSRLEINVDSAKLLQGKINIRTLQLDDASVVIPVTREPTANTSRPPQNLEIKNINATWTLSENDILSTRDFKAKIAGIQVYATVTLDAQGWEKILDSGSGPPSTTPSLAPWTKEASQALDIITSLNLPTSPAPTIRLDIKGKITHPESFAIDLALNSSSFTLPWLPGSPTYRDLSINASCQRQIVTVDRLSLSDSEGSLTASGSLSLESRQILADCASHINILPVFQYLTGSSLPADFKLPRPPAFLCDTELNFPDGWDAPPTYKVTGEVNIPTPTIRGVPFMDLSTDFSVSNGDFYLDSLSLSQKEGKLTGKIMAKGDTILVKANSSLDPSVLDKMIGDPDAHAELKHLTLEPNGKALLDFSAKLSRQNPDTAYTASIDARISQAVYHSVPLKEAKTTMDITPGNIQFGPTSLTLATRAGGTATAKRLSLNWRTWLLDVEGFEARAYPTEFLKLFDDDLSDFFKIFGFREIPTITGRGTIDLLRTAQRMDARLTFSCPRIMDLHILGTVLPLDRSSTNVHIDGTRVRVRDINAQIWGGNVAGNLLFSTQAGDGYSGSLATSSMNLALVGRHFGAKLNTGTLNANITLNAPNMRLATLTATGSAQLRGGNLLEVPFFGPLSPLLGRILGVIPGFDQLAGSTIKDADCPFWISKGYLQFDNFEARGKGLKLRGAGWVNLDNLAIDINMRMYTRGLLGLVTLPLYPLGKIFQFKAEGSLRDPKWAINPFGLND